MDRNELIFVLALVTIAVALAWGLWQFISVRRSQVKRGEPPGPAAGTEEMLHHGEHDAARQQGGDVQPIGVSRTPRRGD